MIYYESDEIKSKMDEAALFACDYLEAGYEEDMSEECGVFDMHARRLVKASGFNHKACTTWSSA